MLSGISLGIIPGWETYDVYEVKVARYQGGRLLKSSEHTIKQTDRFHLVLLPVFWLNFMQPSAAEEFRRVIASDLADADE